MVKWIMGMLLIVLTGCGGAVGGSFVFGGGDACYQFVHPNAGIITLGTKNHPIEGGPGEFMPKGLNFEPSLEIRQRGAQLLSRLDLLQFRACKLEVNEGDAANQKILREKKEFLYGLLERTMKELERADSAEAYEQRVDQGWDEFHQAGYGQGKM